MTRIRTDFDDTTTALQVVEGLDLSGRRAVVTGAASGIGVETARALAHAGAHVTLAVRDSAAGERVAADIARTSGRDEPAVAHLDLADLATVDAFTASWQGPLHVLVNNAGVMDTPRGTTAQGWETQQQATRAEDCHEAAVVPQLDGLSGVLPHALDPQAARRLWEVSEQLLRDARAPTAS
jgi:NAD(P)-dependent dehydrogenase (short-subunit alcohol dehydrogenase family)